jgi:hypothetical protein
MVYFLPLRAGLLFFLWLHKAPQSGKHCSHFRDWQCQVRFLLISHGSWGSTLLNCLFHSRTHADKCTIFGNCHPLSGGEKELLHNGAHDMWLLLHWHNESSGKPVILRWKCLLLTQ